MKLIFYLDLYKNIDFTKLKNKSSANLSKLEIKFEYRLYKRLHNSNIIIFEVNNLFMKCDPLLKIWNLGSPSKS